MTVLTVVLVWIAVACLAVAIWAVWRVGRTVDGLAPRIDILEDQVFAPAPTPEVPAEDARTASFRALKEDRARRAGGDR